MSKRKKTIDPHAQREASRYENPIPSREYILEQLAAQTSLNFRQLVSALSVKGQDARSALRKRLRAMERDSQLMLVADEQYSLPGKVDRLEGIVEAHRDGFGFLLLKDQDDIFLSARDMRQVFHGDRVAVQIVGKNRRGLLEGRVAEVLERNTSVVVGRLKREQKNCFVVPDNPRITHTISVDSEHTLNANLGDYVNVEITSYPDWRAEAKGRVTEVLGEPMAPGLEIDLALHSFDIPHLWPEQALQEAGHLGAEPEEADKLQRVDLRAMPLVTIDGEDARDFDDAVYCEKQNDGSFRLWVAIADVSHYVPVGSALDAEANTRATSVYFPGQVVPMLPEAISNGLCSLNPEVDRLCMVCEMHISSAGQLAEYQFCEAVMHSHARLSYNEVAEALGLLEQPPRAALLKRLSKLLPHLEALEALFKLLRKTRSQRGAIDFETTETQMVFNAQRKIEDIVPVSRNDAHKIIEECMLCANVAAASFLEKSELPALYRVHEGPKAEKLINLRTYLGELGLSLDGGEKPDPKNYQALMQSIADRPDAHLIQIMLLRSLSQAVYDPENNGHFGLAYQAYAHFTSPIRRYPDLLVHRAIKHIVRSRKQNSHVHRVKGAKVIARKNIYPYDTEQMLALGAHCSMAERRADDATRDVEAWLKCEYLLERVGEEFTGVIAGVTNFGIFVELEDLYVEGLVHISSLGKDYFQFDAATQRLVGERTRQVYRLGDKVQVCVARVDLDQRKVDLDLQGVEPRERAGQNNNGNKNQAYKAKQNVKRSKGKPKKSAKRKVKKMKVSKASPSANDGRSVQKPLKKKAVKKVENSEGSKFDGKKSPAKAKLLKRKKKLNKD